MHERQEGTELCLATEDKPAGSLRVRRSGRANTGDVVTDDGYRPPERQKAPDEALFRPQDEASCSLTLVCTGVLSHSGIFWRGNTAGHKQSTARLKVWLSAAGQPQTSH